MDANVVGIDFAPDLVADSRKTQSADGTITLRWARPADGGKVELQQSSEPSFADPISRYSGAEEGSVLTGLPEGQHFFRIRGVDRTAQPGPWSDPFEVQVEFMQRGQLFILLTLGGSVAVLTAGAIVAGHLRTRGND